MAVSSLTAPRREKRPMPTATTSAATRAPAQQVGAQQIGDRDAREDGVRQGVAEERHGAQHDEAAEHRADDADDQRGDEGALHELQRERLR